MEARPIRVAIVGSGMAGLVTAYLLHHDRRQRYHVKVFESGESLSLDSASVSTKNDSQQTTSRVDLPMRAFAGGYYNNLKALYDHLAVQYHSQPFLFEFAKANSVSRKDLPQSDLSYFIHASNLHKLLPPRPCTLSLMSHFAEIIWLIICYSWFSICCFYIPPKEVAGHRGTRSETVDEYLKRIWLPARFRNLYLLPLISSVATCPHQALLAFPASDLTEYKRRTHRAHHYTISNGVKSVQEKLVRGIEYKLSVLVTAVKLRNGQVTLCWSDSGSSIAKEEIFDKVILAVAPDVVGKIFEPLHHSMKHIPTTLVESVVHNDRRLLAGSTGLENDTQTEVKPQLIYLRTSTRGAHKTESLHVQPCGAVVTTCPFSSIDPSSIIHSAKFTRVLRSPESKHIVDSIFGNTQQSYGGDEKAAPVWKNGDDNVWLVGGWCWDGMVLLEGCIISAMRVADAFDVNVPWRS